MEYFNKTFKVWYKTKNNFNSFDNLFETIIAHNSLNSLNNCQIQQIQYFYILFS